MIQKGCAANLQKRDGAARIWLSYYNRVLYEKGMITEQERNRMELRIRQWRMPSYML